MLASTRWYMLLMRMWEVMEMGEKRPTSDGLVIPLRIIYPVVVDDSEIDSVSITLLALLLTVQLLDTLDRQVTPLSIANYTLLKVKVNLCALLIPC